jgi:hypothetical protein
LFSCETTTTDEIVVPEFPSVITVIDNSFPEIDAQIVIDVMEQLQVCTQTDTIPTLPPCSNEYFRIFELGPDIKNDDGFILEMRAGLFGSPVRQIVIIHKTFNKYKIVNQYLGFLIEYRTSASGFNDLLMGYDDPEIGIVAIKHTWEEDKYQPVDVEEINGYFVKSELKDSINHLFIDNFNAGH